MLGQYLPLRQNIFAVSRQSGIGWEKAKSSWHTLELTPQTICRWVKACRRQGNVALKAKKKGRPPGGRLLPWQAAQLAQAVTDHHPEQLKLPFYLWTREAVALLIKRRFGLICRSGRLVVTSGAKVLPRKNRRGGSISLSTVARRTAPWR